VNLAASDKGSATRSASSDAGGSAPLAGIRVLEASLDMAGSVAGMLLGECGAEVIKLELPEPEPRRDSPAFATWNRGKRSIVIDPNAPDAYRAIEALAAAADVLLYRRAAWPSAPWNRTLERTLCETYPRLVLCCLQGDPTLDAAHEQDIHDDILVQARLGMMDEIRSRRAGPTFIRLPLPSWGAAYLAFAGVMARLRVREVSGMGGPANTSLTQGALVYLNAMWKVVEFPSDVLLREVELPKRQYPFVFRCRDGRMLQAFLGFVDVPAVIEAVADLGLEVPDLCPDTEVEAAAIYQQAFATKTSEEWRDLLQAADCTCEILLHVGEILQDPDAVSVGCAVEIDDLVWGRSRQAAVPFDIGGLRMTQGRRAPAHDEDREAILEDGWRSEPRPVTRDVSRYPERYPLEGIRVLDIGMNLSGPACAMLMADLGADVIKVEPPTGDRLRPYELMFLSGNRNKRSLALDLKQSEARVAFESVVRSADVVISNLRPKKARVLGLDSAHLSTLNPQLVCCDVTSYGPGGPKEDWGARDPTVGSLSGWALDGGSEELGHIYLRMLVGDIGTALAAVGATMVGLYSRECTGKGTLIEASLVRTSAMYASEALLVGDGELVSPPNPVNGLLFGTSPSNRIYETRDNKWIAVSDGAGGQDGRRLLDLFGTATESELESRFAEETAADAISGLRSGGFSASELLTDGMRTILESEVYREARLVGISKHPEYGTIRQPGSFWEFGDLSTTIDGVAPPRIGQDSFEIMSECAKGLPERREIVFGDQRNESRRPLSRGGAAS
jgi:crotonobetainyl-CoA:carnitine CoA-transferase CaiB-like acyl-CoA transferase